MKGLALKIYSVHLSKSLFYISSLFIVLVACKSTQVQNNQVVKKVLIENNNKVYFSKFQNKTNFDQVKINSTIEARMDKFVPPIDATIYIENGTKIWINLSSFFINIARGVATNVGIKAYEKWNKTFVDTNYQYLNQLLGLNFLNYNQLQAVLLGMPIYEPNEDNFELTIEPNQLMLTSKNKIESNVQGEKKQYQIQMVYTQNFLLTLQKIKETGSENYLEINYSNWVNFEGKYFPKSVKISIKKDKSSQFIIENTKFEFLKMDAPYSVPKAYEKVEIK